MWFAIVLPAVLLSYLGQGALILAHPKTIANPFFLLVPSGWRIAEVVLATAATIIASQAVISGAFSVGKQAMQLGLLPRLKIVHTSNLEGQIYVPVINWALGIGVAALVLGLQHSAKLADIYGVAVTGTFILNTTLFVAVARSLWHTPKWKLAGLGALCLTVVEVAFFSSNVAKIAHGAWLSLGAGVVISGGRARRSSPTTAPLARNRSSSFSSACAQRSRRSAGCRGPLSSSTPARRPRPWRHAPRSRTTTSSTGRS